MWLSLSKVVGWRWLPHVLVVLLAVVALGGVRIALSQRDDARRLAEARQQAIEVLQQRVRSYAQLIAQRDALIDKQNAGIDALAKAARQNREIYARLYAAADQRAQRHDDRAAQILQLPDVYVDELAQCRAARVLLEQELVE